MSDVKTLIEKFIDSVPTTGTFMETLAVLRSKIEIAEKITNDMREKFKEWGKGDFITCPHCGSHTLLEFVDCHWCGNQVLETVNTVEKKEEVKVAEPVKTAPVETPAPEKKEPKPRGSKKVETKKETAGPVQVQMGNEPAATINFGGAPSKKTVTAAAETESKVAKKASEPSLDEKRSVMAELADKAADTETDKVALKEIITLAGLNISIGDFKKLSLFRAAIVEAINAKVSVIDEQIKASAKTVKVAEAPVEKKEKKARGGKKAKEEPKAEEPDADFPEEMEEVPSKFKDDKKKGPKVVEITDEDLDLGDEDFAADEEESEDDSGEIEVTDDIEGVDLDSIDVEDLDDEDFDLED